MITTKLNLNDTLPLTCTRAGTCCHGKTVFLNPWELATIAKEKRMIPQDFAKTFCEWGGIKLKFNGVSQYKNQSACSQYVEDFGCSVHLSRPLACRLYPLGRQIQSEKVHYIHQGKEFPCLEGCPAVTELPQMTVGEYLQDQSTKTFEQGQDIYLEVMQQLADIAFELFLDSGLAESGNTETITQWQLMGELTPDELFSKIKSDWQELLQFPEIRELENPVQFASQHSELLMTKAQNEFGVITTLEELQQASILTMAIALHLARSIGADPTALAEHWVETAKSHL
ncbi:MAG: YkgJ family cysteine cluster protein [Flavobacteriales bacterium]